MATNANEANVAPLAFVLLFFGVAPVPSIIASSLPEVLPFNSMCLVLLGTYIAFRKGHWIPGISHTPILIIGTGLVLGLIVALARGDYLLRSGWATLGVLNLVVGIQIGSYAVRNRRFAIRASQTLGLVAIISAPLVALSQVAGLGLIEARVQAVSVSGSDASRVVVGSAEVSFLFLVLSFAYLVQHGKLHWTHWLAMGCSIYLLYASFARNLLFITVLAASICVIGLVRRRVAVSSGLVKVPLVATLVLPFLAVALQVASPAWFERIEASGQGYVARVLENPDFLPNGQNSWNYRLRELNGALNYSAFDPLFGSGLGAPYRDYFPNEDYRNFGSDGGVFFVHNLFFWVWTKMGLLGVVGYGVLVYRGLNCAGKCHVRNHAWVAAGCTAVVVGLLIRGLVTPSLAWGAGSLGFGIAVGVVFALRQTHNQLSTSRHATTEAMRAQ